VLLAAVVTPILLPVIGWRGMFLVGLLPALASFVIRRSVGEPELFVEKSAHARQGMPLRLLVEDGRMSIGVFILCAVQNFGYDLAAELPLAAVRLLAHPSPLPGRG
jgi:MFS family permease